MMIRSLISEGGNRVTLKERGLVRYLQMGWNASAMNKERKAVI
jgi:hypothetical protein